MIELPKLNPDLLCFQAVWSWAWPKCDRRGLVHWPRVWIWVRRDSKSTELQLPLWKTWEVEAGGLQHRSNGGQEYVNGNFKRGTSNFETEVHVKVNSEDLLSGRPIVPSGFSNLGCLRPFGLIDQKPGILDTNKCVYVNSALGLATNIGLATSTAVTKIGR